jgi:UDP-N-acetylmuramoyl-tripeptide--D-alanyl-D-alanine ligase
MEFSKVAETMDPRPWTMDTMVFYPTVEEAASALKAEPITHSTVLIKGSRGMALERLVDLF